MIIIENVNFSNTYLKKVILNEDAIISIEFYDVNDKYYLKINLVDYNFNIIFDTEKERDEYIKSLGIS